MILLVLVLGRILFSLGSSLLLALILALVLASPVKTKILGRSKQNTTIFSWQSIF